MFHYIIYLVLARPFYLLFHELGHAIPAMVFDKTPVNIYIGTGGKNLKFSIGRMNFSFSSNILWSAGYVSHPGMSKIKEFIILIMGPLSGLFFSFILLILWDQFIPSTFFFMPIVLFGLIEFLISIKPPFLLL